MIRGNRQIRFQGEWMLINSFKFAQYSKRYLETIPKLKRIKRVPDTLDNRKNI